MLDTIREKVANGERINQEEGLCLLTEAPLLDLAPLAQTARWRLNPEPTVTFVVDTNLNYTNVCDAYCTFCAFYRTERDADAYTHSVEAVMGMIGAAADKGVTTVLMQGGLNPKLPLSYYTELVSESIKRYPQVHPHFFSAPEIKKMAQVAEMPVAQILAHLQKAGLQTIPGGGSEILANRVKKIISRLQPKGQVSDWTEVHREAHKLGIKSTATMMYGHLEEPEDIIEHLEHVRQLEDEAPGFTAFIPWSFKKENNPLGKRVKEEAGSNKYLRMIALSRLYLDNIQHIQASWFSEGKRTGVVALNFGADDFGGTLFDENVMQEAGFYNRTSIDEIKDLIRDAGYIPAQRTTLYQVVERFDAKVNAIR